MGTYTVRSNYGKFLTPSGKNFNKIFNCITLLCAKVKINIYGVTLIILKKAFPILLYFCAW